MTAAYWLELEDQLGAGGGLEELEEGWRRAGGGLEELEELEEAWRRAGGSDLTPAAGVSNVPSSQAYLALLSQASTDESGEFTTPAGVGFSHRRRQHWDKEPSLLYTGIRRA